MSLDVKTLPGGTHSIPRLSLRIFAVKYGLRGEASHTEQVLYGYCE